MVPSRAHLVAVPSCTTSSAPQHCSRCNQYPFVHRQTGPVRRPTRLRDSRRSTLGQLLRGVLSFLLTYSIFERYADIRRQLRRPRGPGLTRDIDTLIAATAPDRGLTALTTGTGF